MLCKEALSFPLNPDQELFLPFNNNVFNTARTKFKRILSNSLLLRELLPFDHKPQSFEPDQAELLPLTAAPASEGSAAPLALGSPLSHRLCGMMES